MTSSFKTSSAILNGGRIDISQIQTEVSQAISHDLKYHREDEMKKRAIRMCKDYNEFQAFVSCSQLKPVCSSDMDQLFLTRSEGNSRRKVNPNQNQILNRGCKDLDSILRSTMKAKRDESSPIHQVKCLHSIPRNAVELEKEWSIYCKDPKNALRYLLLSIEDLPSEHDGGHTYDDIIIPTSPRLSPKCFKRLCFHEITPSILAGVIGALDSFTKINTPSCPAKSISDFIVNWMASITECGRFKLSFNFLDGREKQSLQAILSFMRHLEESDSRVTQILKLMGREA